MAHKIQCVNCGRSHKAITHNFPLARKENRLKMVDGKYIMFPEIIGYLCKWCINKHVRQEEKKNAAFRVGHKGVGEKVSDQEQGRTDNRNTGADVPKSSEDNSGGRKRGIIDRIRRAILQNDDKSGVPAK